MQSGVESDDNSDVDGGGQVVSQARLISPELTAAVDEERWTGGIECLSR